MDKRAKNILFKTYWKNGCWIINDEDRITSKENFEYAKSKGLMFENVTITHDECINEILEIYKKIPIDLVSQAFLSSLSNKRIDWRSSIASYFIAKKIRKHKYLKTVSGHGYDKNGNANQTYYSCGICMNLGMSEKEKYINEDLNVMNFERIKWGGIRLGHLLYTLLDLKLIVKEEITRPTYEDIEIFKNILKTVESSQPKDYPSVLRKRLSENIKYTKNEIDVIMEIMACVEILKPASYDRPTTGRHDWHFVEFWRGEDKYNQDAVNIFFGKYL
jgi:hypothetical protein